MKKHLLAFLVALLALSNAHAADNFNILDKALYPTTYGTSGQCWISNGNGVVPSWQSCGGGGGGTVTSVSVVTANGVSGSVATATTTPAITLTLGAITPTSVNSGAGTFTSLTDSGLTSTRIPVAGTGGLLGDFANLTYSSANSQINVGGTAGLSVGTTGAFGCIGIGSSACSAGGNALLTSGGTTNINATGSVNLQVGAGTKLSVNSTAGTGATITAGTNAAAATTYALDISQTLNNASALGGIRYVVTETSDSASFLPLSIQGGSSGSTALLTLDKNSALLYKVTRYVNITFSTLSANLTTTGDTAYCSDCTMANPTLGSGGGALVTRLGSGVFVGR